MDILIVLFVLAFSEKNPEFKESLQKVLKFYRENRELITALAGNSEPTAQNASETVPPAADFAPEKLRIIEEYLRRQ